MHLTVVETQRPGHALEAVQKLELSEEVDAIVCVGGDGTMSEIIQVFTSTSWLPIPPPCNMLGPMAMEGFRIYKLSSGLCLVTLVCLKKHQHNAGECR